MLFDIEDDNEKEMQADIIAWNQQSMFPCNTASSAVLFIQGGKVFLRLLLNLMMSHYPSVLTQPVMNDFCPQCGDGGARPGWSGGQDVLAGIAETCDAQLPLSY